MIVVKKVNILLFKKLLLDTVFDLLVISAPNLNYSQLLVIKGNCKEREAVAWHCSAKNCS